MTNALDGSEDYLLPDILFALIGDEMIDFQKKLMPQNSVKNLKEVVQTPRESNEKKMLKEVNF